MMIMQLHIYNTFVSFISNMHLMWSTYFLDRISFFLRIGGFLVNESNSYIDYNPTIFSFFFYGFGY